MVGIESTNLTQEIYVNVVGFLNEINIDEIVKEINHRYELLKHCLKPISEAEVSCKHSDVLVLTANPIESKVLLTKLEDIKTIIAEEDSREYHVGKLKISDDCNYNIVHVESKKGSNGVNGSYKTAMAAINRWKPKLVIAVGVAFGSNHIEQSLGDVLFMKLGIPFDDAKISSSGFKLSSDSFVHSPDIRIQRSIDSISKSCEVAIHSGLTAVLSFVVDDENFRAKIFDSIKAFNPIGGEMEAYGIYNAAYENDVKYCAMLKGICDWGVAKNDACIEEKHPEFKDKLQIYAANNACEVLLKLLDPLYVKHLGIKSVEDFNVIEHLKEQIKCDNTISKAIACVITDLEEVNAVFNRYKKDSCRPFLDELKKRGYINDNCNLTDKGRLLIYQVAKNKKEFFVDLDE